MNDSEYTPMIEEVRDFCIQWGRVQHPHVSVFETSRALDRFFAAHDRVVAAQAWDEANKTVRGHLGLNQPATEAWPTNPYRTEENN